MANADESIMVTPMEGAPKMTGRTLSGTVVSNKMNKSITVLVERFVKHPIYGKYIRHSRKIHAHDEHNECLEGDVVTVAATRPISKTKTWLLRSIDRRPPQV